jgi:hypothetical protein
MTEPTFILTAELDDDSFAWLNDLRSRHFPPERNVLAAHLTLFHRLSGAQIARIASAALPEAPLAIGFDAVVLLGFGNAIRAASPELMQLRAGLKQTMGGSLSRQDEQRWSPHVTIQNKVLPDQARHLHKALGSDFATRAGQATGVLAWEYLGGPWRLAHRFPFAPR